MKELIEELHKLKGDLLSMDQAIYGLNGCLDILIDKILEQKESDLEKNQATKTLTRGKDMNEVEIFAETDKIYQAISQTIHFKKWKGRENDLMLIICKAKQLGMNVFDAVNGALYSVQGKIEMTARTMNAIIRAKGHSIKVVESTNKKCVLEGKRADNGDSFRAEFTIEEATTAGLLRNNVWKSYAKDMLFARALSRLARQLFSDTISDCYVEGEISLKPTEPTITSEILEEASLKITEEQAKELHEMMGDNSHVEYQVGKVLDSSGYSTIEDINAEDFERFKKGIDSLLPKKIEENKK